MILPFSGIDTDSTLFSYSSGKFLGTHTDSNFSEYSPGFYHFPAPTLILPFLGARLDSFSVLAPILPFPSVSRILPFFRIDTDSTLFRYSSGKFFDTRTDSTFS